jgi:hypothetical protein
VDPTRRATATREPAVKAWACMLVRFQPADFGAISLRGGELVRINSLV